MPKTFPQSMQNNSSSKNSKKNVSSNNISLKKCKQKSHLHFPPPLVSKSQLVSELRAISPLLVHLHPSLFEPTEK